MGSGDGLLQIITASFSSLPSFLEIEVLRFFNALLWFYKRKDNQTTKLQRGHKWAMVLLETVGRAGSFTP